MKKILAFALAATMLSSVFVMNVSAAPVRGPSTITIPRAENMVVDGVRDAAYGSEYFIIDQLTYPAVGVDSAASARAWGAWNDTHLFMFIEVVDSTPNADFPGGFFYQDGVEIYFDWNNAILATAAESAFARVTIAMDQSPTSADYQATLRRESQGDTRSVALGAQIREHLEFVVVETANGYNIEFALCLDWALQHPVRPGEPFAVGREIGIEIMVNDNQLPDGVQRAWSVIRGFPHPIGISPSPTAIGAVMVLGEAVAADAAVTVTPVVTPAPAVVTAVDGDEVKQGDVPVVGDVMTISLAVLAGGLLAVFFVVRKKVTA